MPGPPSPENMKNSEVARWWERNEPGLWEDYLAEDPEAEAVVAPSFRARMRALRQ